MKKSEKKANRISLESTDSVLVDNPFGNLELKGLGNRPNEPERTQGKAKKVNLTVIGRGERLDVRREKAGRGGKTVTTVTGFPSSLSVDRQKRMLGELKRRLGSGGSIVDKRWELQGDHRDQICDWLTVRGFRHDLAGG